MKKKIKIKTAVALSDKISGYVGAKGTNLLAASCRLHDATYARTDNWEWRKLDGGPLWVDSYGWSEDLTLYPDKESFEEAKLLKKGRIRGAIRRAKRFAANEREYAKRIMIMGRLLREPNFVIVA